MTPLLLFIIGLYIIAIPIHVYYWYKFSEDEVFIEALITILIAICLIPGAPLTIYYVIKNKKL